jgi:hypothetical protein
MTASDFEMLLQIIGCKTAQTDTKYWAAIPLFIQLAVTFRYLARSEYIFKISKQSTSAVIPEVCEALIDILSTYVKESDCNQFYSVLYFVRYGNIICQAYTSTVWKLNDHLHTKCYLTYTFSKSHIFSIAKKCAGSKCWVTCNWLQDRLYTDGEEFDDEAQLWWSSATVTREWEHAEYVPEAPE